MAADSLEQELEKRLDALGFEFVELERAGSRARPVLRVRIDRPDSTPGHGVSVDDCIRISRELEAYLDAREDLSDRYVLEVSSPGLERPLVRRRDFERFAGREVALKGAETLAGRSRRLEGVLLGIDGAGAAERVRIRLADGAEVEIPRSEIARAHLIYRWDQA